MPPLHPRTVRPSSTLVGPGPSLFAAPRLFRALLLAILYVAVASIVLNTFMLKWSFCGNDPRAGFERLVTYSAYRPFAYRVLSPTVVRVIARHVPRQIASKVLASGATVRDENFPTRSLPERFHWLPPPGSDWASHPDLLLEHYVAYGYLFLTLLSLLLILRALLGQFDWCSQLFRDLAPIVALLLLPLTFVDGGYLYDFPELMLAALGLLLLLKQNWAFYYGVIVLACLNKETGFLIGLYFIGLYVSRHSRTSFLLHLVLHATLVIPAIGIGHFVMRANPGLPAEWQLLRHLRYLLSETPYVAFYDDYALFIPVPGPLNVAIVFLVGFAAFFRWGKKPVELRRAFGFTTSALIVLFVTMGHQDEIRVFYPSLPPLFLLACDTVARTYRTTETGA
jgi:hypothetical protein